MNDGSLNLAPIGIDTAKRLLLAQYSEPALRQRATMLWGSRGIGKSSIVQQIAAELDVPLIDLRLTTIEPVDLRGAPYADDEQQRTVWFPPEFLPEARQEAGILFLDELTAADQRLQISAYSLILDRRVGLYRLPEQWMIVAAGNAAFHGAISHDMGTALADRLFHFHIASSIEAFLAYAVKRRFAPEVTAFLRSRPDRLDDTAAQLDQDHLVGASPRGWEAVSDVIQSSVPDVLKRRFVEGRIGQANAAEFHGVLAELESGADILALIDARPGEATRQLLPATLDGLYGLVYGLVASLTEAPGVESAARLKRLLAIIEQFSDLSDHLPAREAETLAMELLIERALGLGFATELLDDPAYRRYADAREVSVTGSLSQAGP